MQEFIVAEVSKNWYEPHQPDPDNRILAQRFEEIINVNLVRGYALHSFQLHRLMVGPKAMNETIIAVFRRQPQ